MTDLRQRTLVALALERTPGFNYSCNFLGVRFPRKEGACVEVQMDHAEYCEDESGQVDITAASLLADVAMGSVVRANLSPAQRLATVSLHLQFTGIARKGPLTATGEFDNFVAGMDSRQGLCRCTVNTPGGPVIRGSGAFMVMEPPAGRTMHPVRDAIHAGVAPLDEVTLTPDEAGILARAERACSTAGGACGFLQRFWGMSPERTAEGAHCRVENGAHLGNRVGHMQGGLQTGLAIVTAEAALPLNWTVSSISAWFLHPGQGKHIVATSRLERRGLNTAVVRTALVSDQGQRVLEAMTTHIRVC